MIFSASCLSKSNFKTCLSSGTPRVVGWPEIPSKILGNEIVLCRPVAKVLELELHQRRGDVNRQEAIWLLIAGSR